MTHLLLSILVMLVMLAGLSFVVSIVTLIAVRRMEQDVNLTRSDVITIRRWVVPGPGGPSAVGLFGGRPIPTVGELQAAKNRVDPSGTAHPGS